MFFCFFPNAGMAPKVHSTVLAFVYLWQVVYVRTCQHSLCYFWLPWNHNTVSSFFCQRLWGLSLDSVNGQRGVSKFTRATYLAERAAVRLRIIIYGGLKLEKCTEGAARHFTHQRQSRNPWRNTPTWVGWGGAIVLLSCRGAWSHRGGAGTPGRHRVTEGGQHPANTNFIYAGEETNKSLPLMVSRWHKTPKLPRRWRSPINRPGAQAPRRACLYHVGDVV